MSAAQIESTQKTQNPQPPGYDLPEGGTVQDWLEVVNQFVYLAQQAGLQIQGKTVPLTDGESIIVYRVKNAHFCPSCNRANIGTAKCHNPDCPRNLEPEQETQNPQAA